MGNKKGLGGIDFIRHQEMNGFRARLQTVIYALAIQTTTSPHFEHVFYALLGKLPVPTVEGAKILPGLTSDFRTRNIRPELQQHRKNKLSCLVSTVAFIITQWWEYCGMVISSGRMNLMIDYLENIADRGLDAFEVRGSVQRGWRLHECKR